jgi:hypothetical protein
MAGRSEAALFLGSWTFLSKLGWKHNRFQPFFGPSVGRVMTKIPPLSHVSSSNLHSIGHDGTALYVRFRGAGGGGGAIYRYPTAGQDVHDALAEASSPGRHFQNFVKSAHAGEKVG